jgi:hypothetical protein
MAALQAAMTMQDPNAMALVADIEQGRQKHEMLKKVGRHAGNLVRLLLETNKNRD